MAPSALALPFARSLAICITLLIAWKPAAGQVYKCSDARQQLVYQDTPCPEGRALRDFSVDPPPLSVVPMRPPAGTATRITAERPPKTKVAASERKVKVKSGDPAERRHIRLGMPEGEVIARIGPPDMKSGGSGRKVARWTYLPDPRDPQTLTTIVLETGLVVDVERKVMR